MKCFDRLYMSNVYSEIKFLPLIPALRVACRSVIFAFLEWTLYYKKAEKIKRKQSFKSLYLLSIETGPVSSRLKLDSGYEYWGITGKNTPIMNLWKIPGH
jgi:hypothetical protein